jgi:hypothetical protein
MFVPLLLDLVRVKDRSEIFLVFGLDRAKKQPICFAGSDIVAHGIHWTMLEDAEDNGAS